MVTPQKRLIAEKIKALPMSPGVYFFKDSQGKILYIGKASYLKKRVSSYFSRLFNNKTQSLVKRIADIDYILTSSEEQALIKEAALIKEHLPAYNTALRDDKSFPFICITKEDFPRVFICRQPSRLAPRQPDYYRVFGPYTNAGLLQKALKTMRSIFPFCSCGIKRKKSCLYYRIHLCSGPCLGAVTRRQYQENINNIVMFLEGRGEDLLHRLFKRMQQEAKAEDFEAAAKIRNQIQALESVLPLGQLSSLPSRQELRLEQLLGLRQQIKRIEAFDVSNIFGAQATASLVSFYEGMPDKANYRRFRIKTVRGIDDYQMLKEAIARRYRRLLEEKMPLPDLIIIDGGRGHLSVAKSQLDTLGMKVPVVSIAKEKEELYLLNRRTPLRLRPDSKVLLLIQRIRDEAHRFAVSYHHLLRRKKLIDK